MTATQENIGLIYKKDNITDKDIQSLTTLLYDKIFVLSKETDTWKSIWKVNIVNYTTIEEGIQHIFALTEGKLRLFPFFSWERLAKNSIDIYNTTFKTNVKYTDFKNKDAMNTIFQTLSPKRSTTYTYEQLIKIDYDHLFPTGVSTGILKPQWWCSSLLTFFITSREDFSIAKNNITPNNVYIIEQYFDGELNSIDFYCDWKEIYLLAYIKEIPLKELEDKQQLSSDFLNIYKKDLTLFNFFIPIRYNEELHSISEIELTLLSKIKNKLHSMNYRWFIHLEYKYNKETNALWIIERGARLWFKRNKYIEQVYNNTIQTTNIPYYVATKQPDIFTTIIPWIHSLIQKNTDTNILGIRTTFYVPTKKYFSSLNDFKEQLSKNLHMYFLQQFWAIVKNINYSITYQNNYTFYPFYQRNDTRLDYILFFNNKDFQKIKLDFPAIIERLIFNDFKL